MNKEFRELYDADIARYGGKSDYILRKFLSLFRHEQTAKTRFGRKWYHYRFTLMRYMLHIEMWAPTKIGKGLYVGHPFCIGVNPRATIGENCNIHKSASVGQENRGPRKGYPTIGNYVWLGMGSTIVGNVTIGNDVLIAPNAYVNCSVPDHSVVFGNPCIIKRKYNATAHYINNPVPMSDPELEKQIWCGEEEFKKRLAEEEAAR